MFRYDSVLNGRSAGLALLLAVAALAIPAAVHAQGTRFLRQPDVSSSHIVFVHATICGSSGVTAATPPGSPAPTGPRPIRRSAPTDGGWPSPASTAATPTFT